jgi:hypothetical protein
MLQPLPNNSFGEALGKQSVGNGDIVLGKRNCSLAAEHRQQHHHTITRRLAGIEGVQSGERAAADTQPIASREWWARWRFCW